MVILLREKQTKEEIKMTLRKITKNDIFSFQVITSPEDESYHDDDYCEGFATRVEEMIEEFGEWGWCTVEVRGEWKGFTANRYLGCCSYEGLEDFTKCSYYTQMCNEVKDQINNEIAATHAILQTLEIKEEIE
jgi:hypothetical protein